MIAEDEAIIRMDLRETLEEEGYEVVGETGRGDQAVDLVRELLPDLAILDVKMPGLDGLEVARIVNAEKLCGVLILTAFSQREIVALGEQLEARKSIERAKGILMDERGLSEQDAFAFIQRTAMSERSKMRAVAERIVDGSLRP